MSKIAFTPDNSGTGTFTIASPNSNTDRTLTLPDATGTVNVSGLANEVPAGSAGAPAIYPTGDSNTGVFFPAADTVAVATGGLERMRITDVGRVGIGEDVPDARLHVKSALDRIAIFESTDSNSAITLIDNNTTGGSDAEHGLNAVGDQLEVRAVGNIGFETNGAERARIDSAGNLLVGKTTSEATTIGVEASANGSLFATRSLATAGSDSVVIFDRNTTVGGIIRFRYDGSTIGYIGNDHSSGHIGIYSPSSGIGCYSSGIYPVDGTGAASDNTKDLGSISVRWDDIYATNATIQTSDRNEKQDIRDITEAEARAAQACKGLLKAYRWKDAVAEKGEEARIHFGIIAQDLQDAFAAEGLDAGSYAMFISSTWWELDGKIYETAEEAPEGATERARLGVRYPELFAFIISAL